jgi:hypothetical protein
LTQTSGLTPDGVPADRSVRILRNVAKLDEKSHCRVGLHLVAAKPIPTFERRYMSQRFLHYECGAAASGEKRVQFELKFEATGLD